MNGLTTTISSAPACGTGACRPPVPVDQRSRSTRTPAGARHGIFVTTVAREAGRTPFSSARSANARARSPAPEIGPPPFSPDTSRSPMSRLTHSVRFRLPIQSRHPISPPSLRVRTKAALGCQLWAASSKSTSRTNWSSTAAIRGVRRIFASRPRWMMIRTFPRKRSTASAKSEGLPRPASLSLPARASKAAPIDPRSAE